MAARIDDESEGKPPGFFKRVCSGAMRVIRGARTAMTCVFMVVAGFADQLDLVNIMDWVRTTFAESAKVGAILVAVGVGFFCLRMVTKGPMVGTAAPVDEGE